MRRDESQKRDGKTKARGVRPIVVLVGLFGNGRLARAIGSIRPQRHFGMMKPGETTALDYFLRVKGTENCVFSHINFNTPPPAGFCTMSIVNWLTVFSSGSFFRSTCNMSRLAW